MEGQTVNDFEIKRIIGEGSLGPVYLAEHKFIKKLFVLKFLPDTLLQDVTSKEKFTNEIGKIASLEHDNITTVHNVSSYGDRLFIVSDFISYKLPNSMNLSGYLSTCTERLKEGEILQILKEVAFALDYIHGHGLMKEPLFHGGLKLSNILLQQKKDGGYTIKLSDVGITSMIGVNYILNQAMESLIASSKDKMKSLHQKRSYMQTLAFLAPEQRFTEGNSITFKCDTYAFGVLTYFLLMGYLPEGYFAMPSSIYKNSNINWDLIIKATLAQTATARADNLTTLIKDSTSMIPLEEVVIPQKPPIYSYRDEEKEVKEMAFSVALPKEEVKEMSYTKIKPATKIVASAPAIPLERETPKTAIEEFEKNLIGEMSRTFNVSPMKMKWEPSKPIEEVPNIGVTQNYKDKPEVRAYKPEKVATDGIKPTLTDTVEIKAGSYERGCEAGARDEKPRHTVILNSFAMDIHPVTNEQFLNFLLKMEGEKDALNNDTIMLRESRIKRQSGELMIETGYAKHPVVGVSYYGAKAYAEWVGRRLPTEAEWEIAATNGNVKNIFPFGDGIERSEANFFSADTTPVMSYPPSKNGLYDMVGNVYEWCEDWYDYSYYEISALEPSNPKGPKQGVYRVLRGGCWKSLVDDMRCSHRFRNNPGTMNKTYGFRCVLSLES